MPLADDLVLDARRVVWLPTHRTLVVPDVHLGFAWVQRRRGQLLPVEGTADALTRLAEVTADYRPQRIVFLGDLVHAACDVEPLRHDLTALVHQHAGGPELVLVLGNHDHRLPALLAEWSLAIRTVQMLDLGRFRLIHGHEPAPVELLEPPDRLVLIGHEHPSVELGDGVATRMKCPAFAWDDRTLVIPAFSEWAAGCNLQRRDFLGPVARSARFHTVAACLGPRLLRVPYARLLQEVTSAGTGSRAR